MMFGPTTQGAPHVRTGKLKLLGVTGPRPSGVLPEAAPLSQQGFPGLVVFNWEGVAAPAKTPDAVVETISAGWNRVMGDAGVRAKLAAMDLEPTWDGPEVMRGAMADDLKRWAELAKRARIEAPN